MAVIHDWKKTAEVAAGLTALRWLRVDSFMGAWESPLVLRRQLTDLVELGLRFARWSVATGFASKGDEGLVAALIDGSQHSRSVTSLAAALGLPPRSLRHSLAASGYPSPSQWLAFGRILKEVLRRQSGREGPYAAARPALDRRIRRHVGVSLRRVESIWGWHDLAAKWFEARGTRPGGPR